MKLCLSVIILAYSTRFVAVAQEVNEPCTIQYNGQRGVCKYDKDCPSVIAQSTQGIRPSFCGFDGPLSIVCCDSATNAPPQGTTTNRGTVGQISRKYCADVSKNVMKSVQSITLTPEPDSHLHTATRCNYNGVHLISGGEPAGPGEFPHMVALGRQENGKITWHCGGTLISENYVLTAAHCQNRVISVEFARIGDLDLEKNENVKDEQFNPITVRVVSFTAHSGYKTPPRYNDIALAKLDRRVTFTKYVRPACLWQSAQFDRTKTIATGWGATKNNTVSPTHLRKVVLDIIPTNRCEKESWVARAKRRELPQGLTNTVLCAGDGEAGTSANGVKKDTCQGDSGGPIVVSDTVNSCVFHVIGVTSFGTECAQGASAIYTRVSEYIDWIESRVWPA